MESNLIYSERETISSEATVSKLVKSIKRVFINKDSLDSLVAKRIQSLFPQSQIEIVEKPPFKSQEGEMSAIEFNQSKQNLWITPFKGTFFKRCPGASQKKTITCCNYFVLNLGQQCNMNCSYCYLQSYLNTPSMVVYSNIDDALRELSQMPADAPYRIGTGEVIDSLSLDPLTHFTTPLIEFFYDRPKWILELKTKSDHVDQFVKIPHNKNIVVSWSINPQWVIEREEHGTASFMDRLNAAKKCSANGFPIAFHLDPMIYHEGWQDHYGDLIKDLTKNFDKEQIHGVTIGTLRFQPEQRHIMRERFGMKSLINQAEMFPSESGKWRYDHQIRNSMFRFALESFKKYSDWPVSICMETPESWIASYDKLPSQIESVKSFYRPIKMIEPID